MGDALIELGGYPGHPFTTCIVIQETHVTSHMHVLHDVPHFFTESIAVGDKEFVMETKAKLGSRAIGGREIENDEGCELKEPQYPYTPLFAPEKSGLSLKNDYLWKVF